MGGQTVFPLSDCEECASDEDTCAASPVEDSMSFETIDEWSSFISEQHEYHEEGDRPQLGRICPQSPGADPVRDPCVPTMESVADLCERRDSRCIVRAISGNAVLFYNHAHDGSLSARSIHGSCSVQEGNKVILAKFWRPHAPPWLHEDVFRAAIKAVRPDSPHFVEFGSG